ncbi:MAG: FAD-binding oxidoreductase [Pseudomonadota bacterium]
MNIEAVKSALDGIKTEDNPAIVKQKSRDFYWYSPVLKAQLDHVVGDLVVSPKSEAEVIEVVKACYAHDVPITTRGSGTGNYGQAMPLSGGVVLSMSDMKEIKDITPGRITVEAGVICTTADKAAREHSSQELRMHPSTAHTATVAGFVAGGSGGVGSITWGGLRDLGNIIRVRVVTMEEEPRVLDLTGEDIGKVAHAYGTNGIITEVEVPLAPAYDWVDVIVAFDDIIACAEYCNALGNQDGILLKELGAVAAPVPHEYFLRHKKFLQETDNVAIISVAPFAMDAFATFTARYDCEIRFRSDEVEDLKGLPPIFELGWNHTTLRGLRVDPSITYLQVLYPYPNQIDRVRAMHEMFGDEVPIHLEFVRFDGNITCFGLPIVRYTTEERLNEIIRLHEDNGCPIFNPHRYTLEEGGMKQSDPVQLAFKKEADPKGLLNPGKMIAWDDPDFDFSSGQTWLFPGLQAAS